MAEILLFEFQNYKFSDNETDRIRVSYEETTDVFVVRTLGYRGRVISTNSFDPYTLAPHVNQLASYKRCLNGDLIEFRGIASFPYAQKVVTSNAPICALNNACDIRVVTVDTVGETLPGAGDGTATVNAVSTWSGITYSLDNSVFQESPTFTALDPGPHTVYVRDSKNCVSSTTFTIAEGNPNAYGLRFFIDYDNYKGKLYSLRIKKKFYTGVPEQVCGTGVPVSISYRFGDKWDALIGSELKTEVLRDATEQFAEMFTSDEREYLVELWERNPETLVWKGFSLPDVYSEPFLPAKAGNVQIVATDGIGTLKDRPFLDSAGRPYTGTRTALEVIVICLKKLDLFLDIWESVNWFETSMEDDQSPLVQLSCDLRRYYDSKGEPLDCMVVLRDILTSLGAQLMQAEGAWHITQPNAIWRDPPEVIPPPPVVYPNLYFDLVDARITPLTTGAVTLLNVGGGDPANGPLQFSVDNATWKSIFDLTTLPPNGYVYDGLTPGATYTMLLRRRDFPGQTASRMFTVPAFEGAKSLVTRAGYSNSTNRANVVFVRENATEQVTVFYQVLRLSGLGNDQMGFGEFILPANRRESLFVIPGYYSYTVDDGSIATYELVLLDVTPAGYSYQKDIPIGPNGT